MEQRGGEIREGEEERRWKVEGSKAYIGRIRKRGRERERGERERMGNERGRNDIHCKSTKSSNTYISKI